MTITIFQSRSALSVDGVRALPLQSTSVSWSHIPLERTFSWSLALDPATVWFRCSLPGGRTVKSDTKSGEFVEGLWEFDVAEVFVQDAHGAYQEFNLAPNGAWWSMTHSEYRVRSKDSCPAKCLSVTTGIFDGYWEVVAAFERGSLQVPLELGGFVHVTGIHYAAEPIYLSSHPPRNIAPDFHHPSCFLPVVISDLQRSEGK